MEIHLSSGILAHRGDGFRCDLRRIDGVARRLDRDIRVRGLRVEVRRHVRSGFYSGWAYPTTSTRRSDGYVAYHPDGRIILNVGDDCEDQDVARLYAHELRHIGQYHRGRKRHGFLTPWPLDVEASELDAESFEGRVLERI